MLIPFLLVTLLSIETPAPDPSPLKTIVQVRSKALCATLRENIAPALAALSQNERIVDFQRNKLLDLGRDRVVHSLPAWEELDRMRIENTILPMEKNIETIDALLQDPKKFATDPHTVDEHDAARIKAQLLAILTQQKAALNQVDGMLETTALAQSLHLPEEANAISIDDASGQLLDSDVTQDNLASSYTPGRASSDPRAARNVGLVGMTGYGMEAAGVGAYQVIMESMGRVAAAQIIRVAADCNKPTP